MPDAQLSDIARVIQLSLAPAFLLTAISALLNAMITRLGRIVDRIREIEENYEKHAATRKNELRLLEQRLRLAYRAAALAVFSGACIAAVIVTAFIGALAHIGLARLVAVLFMIALTSFISALLVLLRELALASASVKASRLILKE